MQTVLLNMFEATLNLLIANINNPTDVISGGAGWVGSGLFGLVLGWLLFFHLPEDNKKETKSAESKDAFVKDMMAEFKTALAELTDRFAKINEEYRADYIAEVKKSLDELIKSQQK